jgi:hypothetical protein
MTDYHIRAHSNIRAKGLEPPKPNNSNVSYDTLELCYPADVLDGVSYEEAGYRHLRQDFFILAEKASKVVIIQSDGRRRVVKQNGMSIEPYFE